MFRVDTYKKTEKYTDDGYSLRDAEYMMSNQTNQTTGLRMFLANPLEVCEDIGERYKGSISNFDHAEIFWSDDIMRDEEFIPLNMPKYLYALHIEFNTKYYIIVSRVNLAKTTQLTPVKDFDKWISSGKKVFVMQEDVNGKMQKVSRTVFTCSSKPGEDRISRVGVDGKREYVAF